MSAKTFQVPQRDELFQRLLKVNSAAHLQQQFYPKLLNEAGSQKAAMGVVVLLQLAICDYTEGLPPVMWTVMNQQVPAFIGALCPDAQIAAEARAFFDETMATLK